MRYLVVMEQEGQEYVIAETPDDEVVADAIGGRIIPADSPEPVARAWAEGDDSVYGEIRRGELLELLGERVAMGEIEVPESWLEAAPSST